MQNNIVISCLINGVNLRCVPALIPREHEFFNDNMAGLLTYSHRLPWGLPTRFVIFGEDN